MQGVNTQSVEDADVFALDEQAGQFCVEVFFFRNWQNWGNRAYFPRADKSMSKEEVLSSFMAQFYDDKPAPRLILTSHEIEDVELMAAALSTRAAARVEIHVARRGERRQLVEYGLRNAKEALGRRLADKASQQKLLVSLSQAFGMTDVPRRVEVYDNSHIMGTNAVGAMIVAGAGGFMKQHYRTFNMKSEELKPGDDYGMMKEMLRRRFARLVREARLAPPEGGGEGAAAPAAADLALLAVAPDGAERKSSPPGPISSSSTAAGASSRRRGRRFRRSASAKATSPSSASPRAATATPVARASSRLARRPSSCRPAIRHSISCSACATRRTASPSAAIAPSASARWPKNPLDEIPGIGPRRKRALLHHFGTVRAVERAALEDLMKTPGVNAATARAVYDFFHDGR